MSKESNDLSQEFMPLMCHTLPEKLLMKAKKELDETEENVRRGMQNLKNFIQRKNLPSVDDDILLNFLRGSKFNLKKSEDRYKQYILMRYKIAGALDKLDDDKIRTIFDMKLINLLPYRDNEGRVIICTQGAMYDDKLAKMDDTALCFLCFIEFASRFPATSVSGLSYLGCAKLLHFHYYYGFFKIYRVYLPHVLSLPCRLQRMDLINENSLCRWFYTILHPLLPTKVTKRFNFHGELRGEAMEPLHKIYSPSILPHEFGGTLGPIDNNFFKDCFFKFMENFRSDNVRFLKGGKSSADDDSRKFN